MKIGIICKPVDHLRANEYKVGANRKTKVIHTQRSRILLSSKILRVVKYNIFLSFQFFRYVRKKVQYMCENVMIIFF